MVQDTFNVASSSYRKPYPFSAVQNTLPPGLSAGDIVQQLRHELRVKVGGEGPQVWAREDEQFKSAAVIFNGAVKTTAEVVVQPVNATDVSSTIKYCRNHGIEMSVKAAGSGVHGWSVGGHIILDLGLMCDISVSLPTPAAPTLQESFERLSIRPSLPNKRSSESAGAKRTASDAWADSDYRGKSKVHLGESRRSSENTSGSGSSRDNSSTPETSSSDSNFKGLTTSPGTMPLEIGQPRTTYVNPSPTASFVSNTASTSYHRSTSNLVLNTHPDPPSYTIVTYGAGTHSKQLDAATATSQYGAFHTPTSAFPVGSGQFLLGGFGFIGRKHGLAMDNIVEAEVVLADGRIVWVGEGGKHGGEWKADEDPSELWWGLRGAGPILGVVTRFRAKSFYLPSVYAGNLIYVFDRATTPSLLRHVRDCIKGSPRTLYTNIIMTAGPPGAPAIVVIQLCFSGPRSEGESYIQAISSWDGGRSLFQDFSERSFERQQVAVEEVLKGGKGRKWYIKSDLLTSLTDEVIDQSCARFHCIPDGCTWLFEYTGGGALADIKDSCFPSSHRESTFTVAALHQWHHDEPPAQDRACVTTAENWINEVIHPNSPGGPLPCFLQSSTEEAVSAVYGENYPRLQLLKRKMDPTNFFLHSMWPRPGGPGESRQLGLDDKTGRAVRVDILADGYVPNESDGIPSKGTSRGGSEGNVSKKAKAGFEKFDELAEGDGKGGDDIVANSSGVMEAAKSVSGKEREMTRLNYLAESR